MHAHTHPTHAYTHTLTRGRGRTFSIHTLLSDTLKKIISLADTEGGGGRRFVAVGLIIVVK